MTICESISTALLGRDVDRLRDCVLSEYGIEISHQQAESLFASAEEFMSQQKIFNAPQRNWHGWNVWLKNRLTIAFGGAKQKDDYVTAIMHVFFIRIEETEEMLMRLRLGKEKISSSPSRSKISEYQSKLTPINATAARVGPPELSGD